MRMPGIYFRFNRMLERSLPRGLYRRSLIIVIAPIVLLQCIMAGFILNRHWDDVTKVLGRSLAREIGLLTELYDTSDKSDKAIANIEYVARNRLKLSLDIIRNAELPEPINRTFYSIVDDKMTKYLERETGRPFWIDSDASDSKVEIQVLAAKGLIFKIQTDADRAYATSTFPLLAWMAISSLVLLGIAVAFLRNQINPIVELSGAAKSFGMGRGVAHFRPRGATEVKEAGLAFVDMQERISRHVEQRTAMLAGVSHDLRTILTRFRLELAFLGDNPRAQPLREDVDEMQRMLEAYIAFVRGDGGEKTHAVNLGEMLGAVTKSMTRNSALIEVDVPDLDVNVKPNAFRRLLTNLVGNATRYAAKIAVKGTVENHMLTLMVDDDGPGIPMESREDVFRPFVRLDSARNLDETGTGLGLAIALDIAHAHGGKIRLDDSPMGGLRAVVQVPV
jgi:two-component system, OmpR family, osmolarity sensor histidine kinase EnvZ